MANENNISPLSASRQAGDQPIENAPENTLDESSSEDRNQETLNQDSATEEDASVKSVQLGQLDSSATHEPEQQTPNEEMNGSHYHTTEQTDNTIPDDPSAGGARHASLDMLLDVSVPISVELGRTKMLIRDVLAISVGAVIELDRLAGEPVDLFVHSKLLAKGEVVVVDDNFGIRVTQIVSPSDRIKSLS